MSYPELLYSTGDTLCSYTVSGSMKTPFKQGLLLSDHPEHTVGGTQCVYGMNGKSAGAEGWGSSYMQLSRPKESSRLNMDKEIFVLVVMNQSEESTRDKGRRSGTNWKIPYYE